jgi:hypothetical protein
MFLSCPAYAFYLCDEARFKARPGQFWLSVGVIHGLTWILLAGASWLVPRAWQEKSGRSVRSANSSLRDLWRSWNYGRTSKLAAYRKRLLDINAFYWLAARARRKPVHVWVFLCLLAGWWAYICAVWMRSRFLWFDPLIAIPPCLMLNAALKSWVALEGAQQLAEDQKAGALELLLTTPLRGGEIVRGQYLALGRQFLAPLLLIIAFELILMHAEARRASGWDATQALWFWLAGVAMQVADVFALPLVAMRLALTSKSPARATLGAIGRVLVLPWAVCGIGAVLVELWAELFAEGDQQPGWGNYLGLWFGIGIATDLWFGFTAWWRLLHSFRQLATRRFALEPSRSSPAPAAWAAQSVEAAAGRPGVLGIRVARRFFASRTALLAWSGLGLVVLCTVLALRDSEPDFPPPPVVFITRSNGPIRVFPGAVSYLAILPDGSLWRWDLSWRPPIRPGLPVRLAPERVGADLDWTLASSMGSRMAGVRQDGTLWQWGQVYNSSSVVKWRQVEAPERVGEANDWASVSAGWGVTLALKKNGTLWAWGNNSVGQLGNGPGPDSNDPVQIGASSEWKAARCEGQSSFGVRADGTLWIWGLASFWNGAGMSRAAFPTPVRFCQETNWTGLDDGLGVWARRRNGEVWQPNASSANAQAPLSATCQLIASNSLPNRLAGAFCGTAKLYELRADGTLWEKPVSWSVWTAPSMAQWSRFGRRSDWTAVWSGGWTAFGLTGDGTLWTWGYDPGRPAARDFSSRIEELEGKIRQTFAIRRSAPGGMTAMSPLPYQKHPRPLLRVVVSPAK